MQNEPASAIAARAAPLLFVLLWSTGFIGAKLGLPYVEPFTFLALRFAITLVILAPIAFWFAAGKPRRDLIFHSLMTGFLVHGCYLGCVFFAISRGMPAGISALVVALQPLATAFIARLMLGERLRLVQVSGLLVGLAGVALVVAPNLAGAEKVSGVTPLTIGCVIAAVGGISLGTVYQKRFAAGMDIRLSTTFQYAGAALPLALLSLLTEERTIVWSAEFIFALTWLILVLSIGAVGILMWLIRRNSAAGTASLFYLVPAVTAVIAWALFGETLVPVQLVGMVVVMVAVALATRAGPKGNQEDPTPGQA